MNPGRNMHLIAVGLNYKSAPIDVRERLAVPHKDMPALSQRLVSGDAIREAIVVSTCNRVELYMAAQTSCLAVKEATQLLAQHSQIDASILAPHLYDLEDEDALRHLFRVTSSLDSMVIGEPQITGQVKLAYQTAVDAGTVGATLHRCLHEAFKAAKRVRNETGIGENAVSVSFLAVELARQIFGRLEDKQALLIGAGEMSTLAARHLQQHGLQSLSIANRSPERAEKLAAELGGASTHGLDALSALLKQVDIVISSTNAPNYLITRKDMAKIMRARRGRPLFLIDLAVPRDIEPAVHKLDNAYLYDVDDLQRVLQDNLAQRQREAEFAQQLVDEDVRRFARRLKQLNVVPTIVSLREHHHALGEAELQRFLKSQSGLSGAQQQATQALVRGLINKLLHAPIVNLKKQAGSPTGDRLIESAHTLFDLDDDKASAASDPSAALSPRSVKASS